jgi:uncharacterized membrane protein
LDRRNPLIFYVYAARAACAAPHRCNPGSQTVLSAAKVSYQETRMTSRPAIRSRGSSVARAIDRWVAAGLVDEALAERLRSHEAAAHAGHSRLTVFLFGFGGLAVGAGILLFVASQWPLLGPAARFALLVALVLGLHLGATAASRSSAALATTLHAVGTAALGAGIFLAGQIFNLAENWPEGLMLWALGAALGLWLLRDWPHAVWTAMLVPLWLLAEWGRYRDFAMPQPTEIVAVGVGFAMLATAYFSAASGSGGPMWRRALSWLGVIILAGVVFALPGLRYQGELLWEGESMQPDFGVPQVLLWILAVGLPAGVAFAARRREAWPVLVAGALAYVVTWLDASETGPRLVAHLLYAGASIGLVAWGLSDRHALRINIGIIGFASTVLWFYFGNLFDMLGRALGLIVVGVLLLAGGWLLERTRRALVRRIRGEEGVS